MSAQMVDVALRGGSTRTPEEDARMKTLHERARLIQTQIEEHEARNVKLREDLRAINYELDALVGK